MKTRTTTRHAHATRQQRALASPVARAIFGQRLGSLAMGAGAGALALWFTASLLLAVGARGAALALLDRAGPLKSALARQMMFGRR